MVNKFIQIFKGLERAHGVTYIDKKSIDGQKIKGKSFIKREPVTSKLWENHLNGIEPSLESFLLMKIINVDGDALILIVMQDSTIKNY